MIVMPDGTEYLVVDGHVHVGRQRPYQTAAVGPRAYTADVLVEEMDRHGVDVAACFPRAEPNTDYYQPNSYILDAAAQHPGRIAPYARVNPYFGQRCLDQLDEFVERGAVAIKLHPFKDFGATAVNSDVVLPIIEYAAARGLPVMFHSGGVWNGTPALIGDLAYRYPEANFILGHSGGDLEHDAIVIARRLPSRNFYFDTAGVHNPGTVTLIAGEVGTDRIVYGSDRPSVPFGFELGKVIRYTGLDSAAIAAALGGNLAALLGLKLAPANYRRIPLAEIP
jgi:uncharacterized protein